MIKVGTFQKSVAAAPVSQPITGLGFEPKALILWTSAQTTLATWSDNVLYSIGMTDGTRSRSGCGAIQHNVADSNTACAWANAALTIYDYDSVLLAQAALTSFDTGGFTLNWTTNNASAYYINYMAIGGDDLTDVYLKEWTITAGVGNLAVGGVGFQPDLTVHLTTYQTVAGASPHMMLAFGAADSSGSQFGGGSSTDDGTAVGSGRSACDDSWILARGNTGLIPGPRDNIAHVSMDADGFTVNKLAVDTANALVATLCLKGGNYRVGVFNESDFPIAQAVTLVGFRPEGAIIFGHNNVMTFLTAEDHAKMCLGAADGTTQASTAYCDIRGADPMDAQATARTDAWVVRGATATTDQDVAAFTSFDADGFTLTWSMTTNTDTDYGYIAFDTGDYTPPPPPPHYTKAHRPPLTYSLTLKPSVISTVGSAAPADLTDLARDWSHSTRLQGGFWNGTFSAPGNKRTFEAFDTWLGCHVEERSGGMVTWEGMVYEMELSTNGFVYRTSLDQMYNACRSDYTDPLGVAQNTAWVTNAASIARFGRREQILTPDTTDGGVALQRATQYVDEFGWPWPRVISTCPMGQEELRVTVNGYVFTANWRYNQQVELAPGCGVGGGYCVDGGGAGFFCTGFDFTPYSTAGVAPGIATAWTTDVAGAGFRWGYIGATHNHAVGQDGILFYTDCSLTTNASNGTPGGAYSAWFLRQGGGAFLRDLDAELDFLSSGVIEVNTAQVDRTAFAYLTSPTRCWDAIQTVVGQGDCYGNPWRAWVGVGRRLHYAPVDTTPVVYVMDGRWRSDPGGSPINPWQFKPGVGKILNYRWSAPRDGYWLTDPATFLIEEIAVDAAGNISPAMAEISRTENLLGYMAAISQFSAARANAPWTPPPNWNVEANQMNPVGPGGDMHGYWTADPLSPTGYTWIHDESIDLTGYY